MIKALFSSNNFLILLIIQFCLGFIAAAFERDKGTMLYFFGAAVLNVGLIIMKGGK